MDCKECKYHKTTKCPVVKLSKKLKTEINPEGCTAGEKADEK